MFTITCKYDIGDIVHWRSVQNEGNQCCGKVRKIYLIDENHKVFYLIEQETNWSERPDEVLMSEESLYSSREEVRKIILEKEIAHTKELLALAEEEYKNLQKKVK